MSEFPSMADVEDVVADGDVHFRSGAGLPRRVRVMVGRPRHLSDVPGDDWVCPLWMEGSTDGVECFGGVGPVDSLMNALDWVRTRCEELESAEPEVARRSPPQIRRVVPAR